MTLDELSELARKADEDDRYLLASLPTLSERAYVVALTSRNGSHSLLSKALSPALVLALVEVAKGAQASLNQRWPNGVSCGVQNLSCAVITALDNDLEQALSKLSNLSREG